MRKYRGQEIHSMKADFLEIDKKHWGGSDGEKMFPVAMRKNKLISELRKYAPRLNAYRQKVVRMI